MRTALDALRKITKSIAPMFIFTYVLIQIICTNYQF